MTGRFLLGYDEPSGRALYLGVFHAISAFNNAGFALWPDNLMRFVTDPWICLTIAAAVIAGGLGFPVVLELLRTRRRPSRWWVLTRITVAVTAALLVIGIMVFLITEWHNPKTLGRLDDPGKLLAAFFAAVMPRTAGFNSIDVAGTYSTSWLATDLLMFIGGGSRGTAGGIKVTTPGMPAFVVWSDGTVGLSTGITADTTPAGQILLVLLMFIGRTGPLTLGSALALKDRTRRYQVAEERVIVG